MDSEPLFIQYHKLMSFGSGRMLRYVRVGLVMATIGFLAIGINANAVWAYMLAAFFGISGASVWEQSKYWEAAVRAAETGQLQHSIVTISTSCWSDATHYHAHVQVENGEAWTFEFMPISWTPAEGEFKSQAYFLPSMAWPALLETDSGLIFPRYKPVKLAPA
jgi:hypothetical protein